MFLYSLLLDYLPCGIYYYYASIEAPHPPHYYSFSYLFFTYNFSDKTLGKNGFFKSAAIAFVGRNLLYFAARKDFDIDQYASGFNMQTQSVTGNSGDGLSSSTSRWLGFNFNLGF